MSSFYAIVNEVISCSSKTVQNLETGLDKMEKNHLVLWLSQGRVNYFWTFSNRSLINEKLQGIEIPYPISELFIQQMTIITFWKVLLITRLNLFSCNLNCIMHD